jgi:hypothetical protein
MVSSQISIQSSSGHSEENPEGERIQSSGLVSLTTKLPQPQTTSIVNTEPLDEVTSSSNVNDDDEILNLNRYLLLSDDDDESENKPSNEAKVFEGRPQPLQIQTTESVVRSFKLQINKPMKTERKREREREREKETKREKEKEKERKNTLSKSLSRLFFV